MNVLKVQIGVLNFARTLLEITHAHVALAIAWQVMDKHAMVTLLDVVDDYIYHT